mmetsp:Transcript_4588/g.6792  ORF Transcript_4588/g.6792 Transcript_4588/m.6792 type:complete len:561 (-) Transcript_4588:229-1911(-)|eukprot:CAMPEP_0172420626 /NCGR_PEP_ID=MMETSP1064-20121228/6982_1 /TAXON_ID=202472 /ORGANISM="Aulacoseira subarctica , Strain CCAP 1002/5" /LENGTH=560 /DNA_ID=CAMNT_0013160677 /DNA_START=112 /DNA_END=1794 /DNA_ORIENTATION=-
MRSGTTIIFLLSLIGTIGSAFGQWSDYLSSVTDLTDFSSDPSCSVCKTDEIPSSMTIQHTEGLSLDFKFNATLIAAWEKITSAYVSHYYKSREEVSGLGCTTNYQYVEKTEFSWTIYFELKLTYESSSTTMTSQELAQESFTSLTEYNQYLATTGVSIESTEVICAKTPFPTQAPVTKKPTKSPTKKPVTKKPTKSPTKTPVVSPTKKPVTKKPTYSPTKTPVVSPTTPPVAAAAPIAPVSPYPTASPTKAQSSTIPSTMTITSSTSITFNAEFIAEWEQTTSEYMTLYYQNTTEASSVQCYTQYDSYEMIESRYVISYTLYVYVQSSYTYSCTEVTETAAAAFSSQYKKEYDHYFYEQTGIDVEIKKVVQSSSAPTLSPVEGSSTVTTGAPSSSPVAATVSTSTVEGSMNYTYTGVTQILFSESNIEVIAKATGMYITNYYRYNSNVENLQVTATYQGSNTYECGCTTIVYFSFEVSYTSSTLTTDEILTKPFESNLAQLAYEKVLSKLGIQLELDGASVTNTYRTSALGGGVSAAANVNTGLLTLIAGAMGSLAVLLI